MTDQTTSDFPKPTAAGVALTIAILWAITALIVGIVFIGSTQDIEYGGDAYSGIQQAAAQTARAVGWLIIGSGVLGILIALRKAEPAAADAAPATAAND